MYAHVPSIAHSSMNHEIPLLGLSDASGGDRSPSPFNRNENPPAPSPDADIRVGHFHSQVFGKQ